MHTNVVQSWLIQKVFMWSMQMLTLKKILIFHSNQVNGMSIVFMCGDVEIQLMI